MEITLELDTSPIDYLAFTAKQTTISLSIYVKNKNNIITEMEITSMISFAKLNRLAFNSIVVEPEQIRFLFFIK